jgi:hypothetical protein
MKYGKDKDEKELGKFEFEKMKSEISQINQKIKSQSKMDLELVVLDRKGLIISEVKDLKRIDDNLLKVNYLEKYRSELEGYEANDGSVHGNIDHRKFIKRLGWSVAIRLPSLNLTKQNISGSIMSILLLIVAFVVGNFLVYFFTTNFGHSNTAEVTDSLGKDDIVNALEEMVQVNTEILTKVNKQGSKIVELRSELE